MKLSIAPLSIIIFFLYSVIYAQEKLFIESNLVPINHDIVSRNQVVNYQNYNIVNVTQVGNNNFQSVATRNSNSVVNVAQTGNNNYLDVYKNGGNNNLNIIQYGNNNYINDFSLNTGYYSTNMNMTQNGNNLTLINNGSNSISKDLKVTQTGNSGAVYIYNR